MAKIKHHRSGGVKIPLTVLAGFMPLFGHMAAGYRSQGFPGVAREISTGLVGYDPVGNRWDYLNLRFSLLPIILGLAAHKLASAVGVNRALSRAKIPFIRI